MSLADINTSLDGAKAALDSLGTKVSALTANVTALNAQLAAAIAAEDPAALAATLVKAQEVQSEAEALNTSIP